MKSVLVFAAYFVTLASSFPATDKFDLADAEYDPFAGREPVVDTGYFDSYYPSFLDSFNKRIQDIISSLRQTITSDSTDVISSFGDLGKGNTTSYTKIIGNHKVEVNETEYKKDTDFGTSHVRISYVNVRPLHPDTIDEPTGTTEADTEPINKPSERDRESLETIENEIIPNNIDEVGSDKLPQRLQQA